MTVGNERGMVLLLVLVIIALLSALLSDMAFSTLVDLRLVETFRDTTRAEYLARGGVTAGRMILQDDRNGFDAANDPDELWAQGINEYPVADGLVSVRIADLDGRLDLNRLVDSQGNPNPVFRQRFVRLADELGLAAPERLADALVDWLDPDSESQPEGAEADVYAVLRQPIRPANGQLQSLDELAEVYGFDEEQVDLLRPHVSCFGSGRLNLNSASDELLRSWDVETDPATIDVLLKGREEEAFRNLDEIRDLIGVEAYTALNRQLDLAVASEFYQIDSRARVNDGERRMQAIIDKKKDILLWQKVL